MTDYSHYKRYNQYGITDVTYYFVRDIVLDPSNIKEHYVNDDNYEYGYSLFNQDEDEIWENYRKFIIMINKCKFDYYFMMYKIILPITFEYVDEFDMTKDLIDWLKKDNEDQIFNIYAISIVDEIINRYEDYINDIYNNTTAKKIALMK